MAMSKLPNQKQKNHQDVYFYFINDKITELEIEKYILLVFSSLEEENGNGIGHS